MKLAEIIETYDGRKVSERSRKIEEIATACGVTVPAVKTWINEKIVPGKLYREKVEEILGQPIDW